MVAFQNLANGTWSPPPASGLIHIDRVMALPERFSEGEFGTVR